MLNKYIVSVNNKKWEYDFDLVKTNATHTDALFDGFGG
jgi:hypothetical protein